jgi:hypothetical protein
MTDRSAPTRRSTAYGWWLGVALTAVALAIDIGDGAPLKLATSALLFVGCLLAALTAARPSRIATGVVAGCMLGAVLLILFRTFGPGL